MTTTNEWIITRVFNGSSVETKAIYIPCLCVWGMTCKLNGVPVEHRQSDDPVNDALKMIHDAFTEAPDLIELNGACKERNAMHKELNVMYKDQKCDLTNQIGCATVMHDIQALLSDMSALAHGNRRPPATTARLTDQAES